MRKGENYAGKSIPVAPTEGLELSDHEWLRFSGPLRYQLRFKSACIGDLTAGRRQDQRRFSLTFSFRTLEGLKESRREAGAVMRSSVLGLMPGCSGW